MTTPDGRWPEPRPAVSLGWRLRHSWWLLIALAGFGCLTGMAFLYVGIRARRPLWWGAGIAYLAVGLASFVVVGTTEQTSLASDIAVGVFLAVWLGGFVHALLINSSWLRWRAGYVPWWAGQPLPAATAPPPDVTAAGVLPPPMRTDPSAYYGPPAASSPPWQGPPAYAPPPATNAPPWLADPAAFAPPPTSPPTPAAPAPLDVNLASAEQLAYATGLDLDRTRWLVTERANRGGFGSLEEFALVSGIPPHQFAPLRNRLVCVPGPLGHHLPGRILDV